MLNYHRVPLWHGTSGASQSTQPNPWHLAAGSHLRRNARLAEGSSQCHWRVACFAEQVNSPKYPTDPLIPSGYVNIAIENGRS